MKNGRHYTGSSGLQRLTENLRDDKFAVRIWWESINSLSPLHMALSSKSKETRFSAEKWDGRILQCHHWLSKVPRKTMSGWLTLKPHLTEATIVAISVVHVIPRRDLGARAMQQKPERESWTAEQYRRKSSSRWEEKKLRVKCKNTTDGQGFGVWNKTVGCVWSSLYLHNYLLFAKVIR